MNKQGFFYTVSTVLMVLFVISVLNFKFEVTSGTAMNSMETRIMSMNEFIGDLSADLKRVAYITGFRTLVGSVNHVIADGVYLEDSQATFREVFENGTIAGENVPVISNSTFDDWVARVTSLAAAQAINLTIELENVSFEMASAWEVKVTINVSVQMADMKGLASWNLSLQESGYVSILGFEDPVYPLSSFGRVFNKINITPYSHFVNGTNTTNLMKHINGSYYIPNSIAPDFLMRIEGNFSSSQYGIESIFFLPEFSAQGLPTISLSCVDYIYANASVTSTHVINNTYEDWLLLDEPHLATYECEAIAK